MTPMTALVLGFDWKDYAKEKPELLLAKLRRDRILAEGTEILLWGFGRTAFDGVIAPGVRAVRRQGRYLRLRFLYDLIAPALLLQDLARLHVAPSSVIFYDFPFMRSASAVKRAYGARTILYLANLPGDLALTRVFGVFKAAYHQLFEHQAARVIDEVRVINGTTRKYAEALGFPSDRIRTVVLDTIQGEESSIAAARPGAVRARFGIPENARILLSVGRLEPEKGFDRLLGAFAALARPELHLVIAGEGRLEGALRAQADALGIRDRVHLAGFVPHQELWSYFADADAFILLSRSEALGLVVWEAMRMRVPVIVSGAGGLAESVGDKGERGFLWIERDGIAALNASLDACFDDAQTTGMIERAYAYVLSRLEA